MLRFSKQSVVEDSEGILKSAVSYYFLDEQGKTFKAQTPFFPYFWLDIKEEMYFGEVEAALRRNYSGLISQIEVIKKQDLDLVCIYLWMSTLRLIICLAESPDRTEEEVHESPLLSGTRTCFSAE